MPRRGRSPGQLVRCKCTKCGQIEMRTGCGGSFKCIACRPRTLQDEAHSAVSKAVRQGLLPRATTYTCVDCGAPASQYEHRDYTKPLDVEPVCRSCNYRRGPAIGSHATRRTTVYVLSSSGITHGEYLARDLPA